MKNFRTLLLLIFFAISGVYSSSVTSEESVHWQGVEVITDQPDQIETARSIVDIPKGSTANIPLEQLVEKCNAVRARLSHASVMCRVIDMSEAEKIFVVEIAGAPRFRSKKGPCDEDSALPAYLAELSNGIDADTTRRVGSPRVSAEEFVNNDGILDYVDPVSHEHAIAYSTLVRKYDDNVKKLLTNCSPELRQLALKFAAFLGNPEKTLERAQFLLQDEDAGVRNNAYRLVSNFAKYVRRGDGLKIIDSACQNLNRQSFLDQNKSLSALNSLLKSDPGYLAELSSSCVDKISYIKETTFSDQLHGFADRILVQKSRNHR